MLLLLSPARAAARFAVLRRLAARHAPWGAWLEAGGSIGHVMRSPARLWSRAEYLDWQLNGDGSGSSSGDGGGSGKGSGGGRRAGAKTKAATSGAGAGTGVLAGAPESLLQMLTVWDDERFEAWRPGFLAWRARREAEAAAAAARAARGVGGSEGVAAADGAGEARSGGAARDAGEEPRAAAARSRRKPKKKQ